MKEQNDSLIGQQLGIYQIQARLGVGGMARVYRAYHPRLRREVALKVIASEIAERAGFRERFEREAQMVASLEHANIVSIYDFGEVGHQAYLVMQYVGGGTLRDRLSDRQPLELRRAVRYAIQMALALHHAHQRGIIHRDVKPQNMLLSSSDPEHILLSDFGIAKPISQDSEKTLLIGQSRLSTSATLTNADQIVGTAAYMSPEQAKLLPVDARSDVYALGIVLYQMLTGVPPFQADTPHGLLYHQISTAPPPLRQQNPRVPEYLEQIVNKALAKRPADRFPSAQAMAYALKQVKFPADALPESTSDTLPISLLPTAIDTATQLETLTQTDTATQLEMLTQTDTPIQLEHIEPESPEDGAMHPAYNRDVSESFISTLVPAVAVPPMRSAPGLFRPGPGPRPFRRTAVLVAFAFLIVLLLSTLRFFPGASYPGSANNAVRARAFDEPFLNNRLDWQTGTIDTGVRASIPGGGTYTVTVSSPIAVYPHPQAIGLLPDTFTLSATIRQVAGDSNDAYGLAFHFTQTGSNNISCYVLAIDNMGNFGLLEYAHSTRTLLASGRYQASSQTTHTLQVRANKDVYTFLVDNRPIYPTPGDPYWKNSDLSLGQLTLYFAGPHTDRSENAIYKATNVRLSLP